MTPEEQAYFDAMMLWATAALTAAERVLKGDSQFSPWPSGETLSDLERRAESAMMLLALRNLVRATSWTAQGLPEDLRAEVHKIITRFHDYLPGVVNARDALEHFDEYAMGKGRLQREARISYDFELVADPRPVIVVGPIRIDVQDARDACRFLTIGLLVGFAASFETPNAVCEQTS